MTAETSTASRTGKAALESNALSLDITARTRLFPRPPAETMTGDAGLMYPDHPRPATVTNSPDQSTVVGEVRLGR